mmetsp:Transcript_17612/g.39507  ORF Transcript_17612/g.39507 Transcript_17612/m.39507 type:complete len:297 (+) Transcript_17612:353-1243(+)
MRRRSWNWRGSNTRRTTLTGCSIRDNCAGVRKRGLGVCRGGTGCAMRVIGRITRSVQGPSEPPPDLKLNADCPGPSHPSTPFRLRPTPLNPNPPNSPSPRTLLPPLPTFPFSFAAAFLSPLQDAKDDCEAEGTCLPQRAGLGVEHTSDGIYEGQFKEDMRHGLGVFNKKNGAVYTGEWERGDWHGDGLVKQNTRTGEKETFVHWSFGFAISQGLTSLPLVLTRVAQVQKEAVRVAATAREMAEDARAQCEPEEPACLKARADFKYEEKVRVVEEGVVAAARKMQLEEKAKLTSKSS